MPDVIAGDLERHTAGDIPSDDDVGCGVFELGDPIEWQQLRRYEWVRVEF